MRRHGRAVLARLTGGALDSLDVYAIVRFVERVEPTGGGDAPVHQPRARLGLP